MKIQYQEHSMDAVMDYFVAGFQKEARIVKDEWFYDSAKKVVVLKLYVEDNLPAKDAS